jgi:hypothetical protein
MSDLPPIIGAMEAGEMPQGTPREHRTAFFRSILNAMGEAHGALAGDGLDEGLINQVIGNTLCHALAGGDRRAALLAVHPRH